MVHQLYQDYAATFDLPVMKLLCFHVSEHHDETVVRPVWNQIFDEGNFPCIFLSYTAY